MERGDVLWTPREDAWERTRLGEFATFALRSGELSLPEGDDGRRRYRELHRWSVRHPEQFWSSFVRFAGLMPDVEAADVLPERRMPGARWFPDARLNWAEAMLAGARRCRGPAVVGISDSRERVQLSADDLAAEVASLRAGLEALGVRPGDFVAGWLPALPETLVAHLAVASLGAVWTSCAPEFGSRAVLDRLGQVRPKVLFTMSAYRFGERRVDKVADVQRVVDALRPIGLAEVIEVGLVDAPGRLVGARPYDELVAKPAPGGLSFEAVPFDHPLTVLYSSGTTGLPKAIIHGHGGILVEHAKALSLQHDLGEGDRFSWYSTTGWMMWNFMISALVVGAGIVIADVDPSHPDPGRLWRMAKDEELVGLGVSAAFLAACQRAEIPLGALVEGSSLAHVGSTGSPLAPGVHRWVSGQLGGLVPVWSISGGTDVCTAFCGGAPVLEVRAGEISGPWLGVDLDVVDEDGTSIVASEGELVVQSPLPSMPVGFVGDPDGARLRAAYFERFPGRWHHGDRATRFVDGAVVISGRSDATLNRGGIRAGTAELYAVVDALDGVSDSLAVHLEDPEGGPGTLVLVVSPRPASDEAALSLAASIKAAIRREVSPRHVPDVVVFSDRIPRTLSGKRIEVPLKRLLLGRPLEETVSLGSLADPDALEPLVATVKAALVARPSGAKTS